MESSDGPVCQAMPLKSKALESGALKPRGIRAAGRIQACRTGRPRLSLVLGSAALARQLEQPRAIIQHRARPRCLERKSQAMLAHSAGRATWPALRKQGSSLRPVQFVERVCADLPLPPPEERFPALLICRTGNGENDIALCFFLSREMKRAPPAERPREVRCG